MDVKYAVYIYGLLCVSSTIGLAIYFVSIFMLTSFINLVPVTAQKIFIYIFIFLPILAGLLYFIRAIKKSKNNGLPIGFKGWRYTLAGIGFATLIVGVIPTIFMVLNPTPGSASGVGLGMGLIVSFMLTLPAMAGIKE